MRERKYECQLYWGGGPEGPCPPAGDVLGAVPIVKLNRSGIVVECNTASVQYALLEKGLSFGNNGSQGARPQAIPRQCACFGPMTTPPPPAAPRTGIPDT